MIFAFNKKGNDDESVELGHRWYQFQIFTSYGDNFYIPNYVIFLVQLLSNQFKKKAYLIYTQQWMCILSIL